MVFKCQEDSFLKEFSSTVISCEKSIANGQTDQYEVIFEDTILFPEGGGQPCDYGYVNDQKVTQVIRREDKAIHYLQAPLNVGDSVKQIINWERRFDHMQQHSGQHLITAIIDRELKYPTVSWWLGEEVSHVELDTPSILPEQIVHIENIVNGLIRDSKKVTVTVFKEDTPEDDLQEARSARGLPADHKGDIRVINIEDVEGNMCCGTHVSNLSQLQIIKLLHFEKSKRKDKILLYFLVGNRVLKRLNACIDREQKLTKILKCNPAEHSNLVDKLRNNNKNLNRNLQTVLKELAVAEATKLKQVNPPPKYYTLHKKEGDIDFMRVFTNEFQDENVTLFLTTGDEKTEGNFVLRGNKKVVDDLGQKICEMLGGKGAQNGNKFTAKVTLMKNRSKAIQLICDYFKT